MTRRTNPYRKIDSKQIYDNPWIRVVEDQIVKPNGEQGIYGKVLFKNFALGIIPLTDDLETWLVGQYRYMLDMYSWEIPMGGGSSEVDPLESAKRELKEETGLVAGQWRELLRVHMSNSVTDEVGIVYLAQDLEQKEPDYDDTEVLELMKIPFHEAMDMVHRHEITDSLSVVGLLYLSGKLDQYA